VVGRIRCDHAEVFPGELEEVEFGADFVEGAGIFGLRAVFLDDLIDRGDLAAARGSLDLGDLADLQATDTLPPLLLGVGGVHAIEEGLAQRQVFHVDQRLVDVVARVDHQVEIREERVVVDVAGIGRVLGVQIEIDVVLAAEDLRDGLAGQRIEDLDAVVVVDGKIAEGRQVNGLGEGFFLGDGVELGQAGRAEGVLLRLLILDAGRARNGRCRRGRSGRGSPGRRRSEGERRGRPPRDS